MDGFQNVPVVTDENKSDLSENSQVNFKIIFFFA